MLLHALIHGPTLSIQRQVLFRVQLWRHLSLWSNNGDILRKLLIVLVYRFSWLCNFDFLSSAVSNVEMSNISANNDAAIFRSHNLAFWELYTKQENQPADRPTNQPTKLTKGRVRRRRETSSLARFDHSCVWNALLEMLNGASGECAYGNGVLSWRRAVTCQTRGHCYWRMTVTSGYLSFMKSSLARWPSGSWTQKRWDPFGWHPLRIWLWLKASTTEKGGPCPFWIIPWHLPYSCGKARKTSVGVAE
jgi:hypothetical protein